MAPSRIIRPRHHGMEEGKTYPLGILVEICGAKVEPDLEGVVERRIHEYCNYIEGFMHLNQRYDIWVRLSKKSYKKGLTSFRIIGEVMQGTLPKRTSHHRRNPDHVHHRPRRDPPFVRGSDCRTYETRDARAGDSPIRTSTLFTVVRSASRLPRLMSVSSLPSGTRTAGAITGSTGGLRQALIPKGRSLQSKRASASIRERGIYRYQRECEETVDG